MLAHLCLRERRGGGACCGTGKSHIQMLQSCPTAASRRSSSGSAGGACTCMLAACASCCGSSGGGGGGSGLAAESRHGLLVLSSCAPNRAAVLISSGSSLPFWRGRLLLWRGWSRRCICLSRPDGPAKQSKIDVYCADATYVATTCVGCKWSTKASTVPRHNIR